MCEISEKDKLIIQLKKELEQANAKILELEEKVKKYESN